MKQLILVRHAKSSWKDPALTDLMRPLKKRGERDAREMAQRLAALQLGAEKALLSPAKRVVQTADILTEDGAFAEGISEIVPDLYTFSYEDLAMYLKQLDDAITSVVLVGHNPAITDLLNFLALEEITNVPTCGIAVLEVDTEKWSELRAGGAELRHYDYPKSELDGDL